jgi:arylsulfatase A-like enzyme
LVHPLAAGFDSYQGPLYNPSTPPIEYYPLSCTGPLDYYNWVKTTNGVQECTQTYMTTDNVEDAVAFLQAPPEPWFLYLSFSGVHAPMHDPTGLLPPNATQRAKCKAMMEVLDAGIGQVLLAAAYPNPNLYVIVVGDNGTEFWVGYGAPNPTGCFGTQHSKGTLYEGGVNVPLIIAGPGVIARETSVIVNTTDLYATVCDLAGVGSQAEDSRSLMGVMLGSDAPVRDFVFAEQFTPNGPLVNPTMHERAVCDGRYKLIRRTVDFTTSEELFDLQTDPCEDLNLLPVAVGSPEDLARLGLEAHLVALGVY